MKRIFFLFMFCFLIGSVYSQTRILMKITGSHFGTFPGEVNLPGHEDFIEVLGISWDHSNNIIHRPTGGYSVPSKTSLSGFNFLHGVNKSSPIINQSCFDGEPILDIQIEMWAINPNHGGVLEILYQIELEDARIVSVATGTDAECSSCIMGIESVSVLYKKITITNPDGGTSAEIEIP